MVPIILFVHARLDLSENSGLSGDLNSIILSENDTPGKSGDDEVINSYGDERHGTDNDASQGRAKMEQKEAVTPATSMKTQAPKSSKDRGQNSGLPGCLQGLDLHETLVGGLLGAAAKLKSLRWLDVRSTQCRGTLDALVSEQSNCFPLEDRENDFFDVPMCNFFHAVLIFHVLLPQVPATDAGVLRYLDVRYCCDLEGPLPARFEQAVQLQVFYAGTELEPEDLVGTGKVMPGGYWPPSHHIHRPDKKTLSVW